MGGAAGRAAGRAGGAGGSGGDGAAAAAAGGAAAAGAERCFRLNRCCIVFNIRCCKWFEVVCVSHCHCFQTLRILGKKHDATTWKLQLPQCAALCPW